MQEKRKHVRIPGSASIELNWMEGGGPQVVKATCIDVAAGGMRVESSERVPSATNVNFTIPEADVEGTARVRYTSKSTTGFVVGLEFTADTSRELFAYSYEPEVI